MSLFLVLLVGSAQAQTLAPGAVEALPPVSDDAPRPTGGGLDASGERIAGVAGPADSFSLEWPPPKAWPFVWTADDGYQLIALEDLDGLLPIASEVALSADGAAVAGTLYLVAPDPSLPSTNRAFRWSEAEGVRWLPSPDGGRSRAIATSADGAVVVGRIALPAPAADHAVVWGPGRTRTVLLPLDGHHGLRLRDVSGDGSVVVGTSFPPTDSVSNRRAVRSTAETGTQRIPGLDAFDHSEANAISADGRVVVGYAYSGGWSNLPEMEAWRWSEADGLTLLGLWNARDVSADGSTVAGAYRTAVAVVWTAETGVRSMPTRGGSRASHPCLRMDARSWATARRRTEPRRPGGLGCPTRRRLYPAGSSAASMRATTSSRC